MTQTHVEIVSGPNTIELTLEGTCTVAQALRIAAERLNVDLSSGSPRSTTGRVLEMTDIIRDGECIEVIKRFSDKG